MDKFIPKQKAYPLKISISTARFQSEKKQCCRPRGKRSAGRVWAANNPNRAANRGQRGLAVDGILLHQKKKNLFLRVFFVKLSPGFLMKFLFCKK